MKKVTSNSLIAGLMVFMMAALIPATSSAQDVEVFAEGAYTETDLAVYIYANTGTYTLRSFGVKLTYDDSEVTVASAEKNEAVWYLGSAPYPDPDTSTLGEVVVIGGKLDTADPTSGVSGARVLLGKVTFNRTGTSMPFAPTLTINYGRGGDYDNFVTTDEPAAILDELAVSFGPTTVRERGDANADGSINAFDAAAVRDIFFGGGDYVVYADCNADGNINAFDAACVRDKFFGL